ncbi:MAG: putative penicillin-binding protein PbpX [Bacteroidetes bacterium ADurb.Bin037]|mgnify:CR=1 FL=1|nr:MAG: putative penicillin-binding protein PbpX [Bacteroidetes bacterium ADurb.Bin037]
MRIGQFFIIIFITGLYACRPDYQDQLYQIAHDAGIPLIQVAYAEGNRTVFYEISTVKELESGEDYSAVFQAASLSKPVLAYIVMRMAERGEIDLDSPLGAYTDMERFDDKEYASQLTARKVLCHMTGLPNWASSPSSLDWPVSRITFRYRPDSVFSYSGEGYAFLQRAVEQIQGRGLEEIALAEVFIPLKMNASSFLWREEYDSLAVSGFSRSGEDKGKGSFPRANAAYTLRTTAPDYIKFLQALSRGTGLSEQTREEMFRPVVQAVRYAERPRECDAHIFWGLGLGIEKHPQLGEVVFHWGDNGSFRALFLIVPGKRMHRQRILVYFTNSEAGHDIIGDIAALFLKNSKALAIHDWVVLK